MIDRVKNIGLKYFDRNVQSARILFDHLSVCRAVSRIHHQEFHLKIEFIVAFQLLKQFCHQHGILAAGDADRNSVAFFHKLILSDSLRESAPDIFPEFFSQTLFDVLRKGSVLLLFLFLFCFHLCKEPGDISAGQADGIIALFAELLCHIYADSPSAAADDQLLMKIDPLIFRNVRRFRMNRSGNGSVRDLDIAADIYDLIGILFQTVQFLYRYFHSRLSIL